MTDSGNPNEADYLAADQAAEKVSNQLGSNSLPASLMRTADLVELTMPLPSLKQSFLVGESLQEALASSAQLADLYKQQLPIIEMAQQMKELERTVMPVMKEWSTLLSTKIDWQRIVGSTHQLGLVLESMKLNELAIAKLDIEHLGQRLQLDEIERLRLASRFFDMAQAHTVLYEKCNVEDLLAVVPDTLAKSPAIEHFNNTRVLEVFTKSKDGPEDEEAIVVQQQLHAEEQDAVARLLLDLDPRFLQMWHGADQALQSSNPDRMRHFITSLRELTTHVLHRLSPDEQVATWSQSTTDYYNGKPTRKARLMFICRAINHGPFIKFVEKDVAAAIEFFDLFNRGTHQVDIPFTNSQALAIKVRAEAMLRFILEVARVK